jgi:hypothetical protein
MLLPSKWVLDEYKALVVKMAVGSESVQIVKTKYELLCDVETLLGFACIHYHSPF